MKMSYIVGGLLVAALSVGSLEATAGPLATPTKTTLVAPALPSVQAEKVYFRRYYRRYGYRGYGYRRYGYYRPYYGYGYYRRPYIGVGVPFVHFGIY